MTHHMAHCVSQRHKRRTEPRSGSAYNKILVKFGRGFRDIARIPRRRHRHPREDVGEDVGVGVGVVECGLMQADRQIANRQNRHAHHNTSHPLGGEVTTVSR